MRELAHLKGSKLIVLTNGMIPGAWQYIVCTQKYCTQKLMYWSKTGQPKPEYSNAKCDKHLH